MQGKAVKRRKLAEGSFEALAISASRSVEIRGQPPSLKDLETAADAQRHAFGSRQRLYANVQVKSPNKHAVLLGARKRTTTSPTSLGYSVLFQVLAIQLRNFQKFLVDTMRSLKTYDVCLNLKPLSDIFIYSRAG